jgi:hypothetical protein
MKRMAVLTIFFSDSESNFIEFFSIRAMRMVDETPQIVVNFIGWVLLIVQSLV